MNDAEVDMSFYACCQIPERLIRVWANFTERELAVEAARELAGAASGGSA